MVKGGVYFLISLLNQNKMTERGRYYKIEKKENEMKERSIERERVRDRERDRER